MKRAFWAALAACLWAAPVAADPPAFKVAAPPGATLGQEKPGEEAPHCRGGYADDLNIMRPENRAFEATPLAGYTYCIRNTATYENVYYGKGGKLRKRYLTHTFHGTGFAYKTKDGEWYLATNQHVSDHPDVTESDDDVDGIPAGSRKVREALKIVRNESDDYEAGMIPLTKVASDIASDVAIVKTRSPLKLMPYRFGSSKKLRVGNVVQVRGYPLGVFNASNTGRVISVNQLDLEKNWNHTDFVIDALVNSGNSGSPVLAVSCETGELELVGIFHAGYRNAQGLNVVVALDQLRDFLDTHRPRTPDSALNREQSKSRLALFNERGPQTGPWLIPFDDHVLRVTPEANDRVLFSLLAAGYPLTNRVEWAIGGAVANNARPDSLILPARYNQERVPISSLDPSLADPLERLWESIWRQLTTVLMYQRVEQRQSKSPDAANTVVILKRQIDSRRTEQRNIIQAIDFDNDALAWPVWPPPAPVSGPSEETPPALSPP